MADLKFYPKDAYAIMNALVHQATGQSDITVTDTGSFVDAGKRVIEAGAENLYNALGVLISRTIVASRGYKGKNKLIVENSDAFANRIRKISIYARDNQATGMFNTDLYTNLGAGLTDASGVGSQYEQFPSIPVEENYFSDFAWDMAHTQYYEQAKIAFVSEESFVDFVNGCLTEVISDIESTLESKNRMAVLDRIGGIKLMSDRGMLGKECAVNMTKVFNDAHGTNYTTKELLQEHTVAFLECFLARLRNDSELMTYRSKLFHDPMTKKIGNNYYDVLRHTPKDLQRLIYNARLFTQLNLSLAEIFNPDMLMFKPSQGEGVQFWQSINDPYAIDVKPSLPNDETSSEVKINTVLAILTDRDALMVNNKFTGVYSTPLNARHGYVTMYWHYKYGIINSYSENSILYYCSDESTEYFEGDGTEDDFVLEGTATTIVSVTVDGVKQTATTDYTFASNTITFTTAPDDGAIIAVTYK